jgi:hypothetical protein
MENVKVVTKGRAAKGNISKKTDNTLNNFGLNLTIDESLSRYANDPFFIEHAKWVDGKSEKNKS